MVDKNGRRTVFHNNLYQACSHFAYPGRITGFPQILGSRPIPEDNSELYAEYEELQDFSTYSDISEVLTKTDVEMQRLGWTSEQGRDHLIKTYGKRSRTLLTDEELHEFLQYLQSQPDPLAGF